MKFAQVCLTVFLVEFVIGFGIYGPINVEFVYSKNMLANVAGRRNVSHQNIYLKKFDRTKTLILGKIEVYEEVGPVQFSFEVKKQMNGGWKNMMIDLPIWSCDMMKSKFRKLIGGITDECYITPGSWSIDNYDFNEIARRENREWFYGDYNLTFTFRAPDIDVFKHTFIAHITPRN